MEEEEDDLSLSSMVSSALTSSSSSSSSSSWEQARKPLVTTSAAAASAMEELDAVKTRNLVGALACLFGALYSLYVLMDEHWKWDKDNFKKFSVATKIPVEVFCISGPLVLVSAIMYSLMAALLLTEGGNSSVFFLSASWSAIIVDMSFVMYNSLGELLANRIDVVLHLVNLVTVVNTFMQLEFVPITFILCSLTLWGIVVLMRLTRRVRGLSNSSSSDNLSNSAGGVGGGGDSPRPSPRSGSPSAGNQP